MNFLSNNNIFNPKNSLDVNYLTFCNATEKVFRKYPYLEPLRQYMFKDLLVKNIYVNVFQLIKRKLNTYIRTKSTAIEGKSADIVIFVETDREVILENLIPLYNKFQKNGISVLILAYHSSISEEHIKLVIPFVQSDLQSFESAYHELITSIGIKNNRRLYKSLMSMYNHSQTLINEIQRVLKILAPKIVLYGMHNSIVGAGLSIVCKKLDIKDIVIQHGLLQPFYLPLTPSLMITWGRSSNKTLSNLGISQKQYRALGSPRWDHISIIDSKSDRYKILNKFKLDDKPLFVFFSNGNDLYRNGEAPIDCAMWLEQARHAFKNKINILVKLHPNEKGELYQTTKLITFKNEIDYKAVLNGCDLVGSLCSTAMAEAILFEKPVWQFYSDDWHELSDQYKYGFALRISSQKKLNKHINAFLNNPKKYYPNIGKEDVYQNHGSSINEIYNFVSNQL